MTKINRIAAHCSPNRPVVLLLLLCLLLFCTRTLAQEADEITEDIEIPAFSAQELDSLLLELRKEYYNSNYERIIEQAPLLIKNAENIDERLIKQRLTSVLGNAFLQFDKHESAFDLFDESLKEAQISKDTFGILNAYINLGNTFIFKDPKRSIDYFKSGTGYLSYKSGTDEAALYDRASFILYNNLAELYVGIRNPKRAKRYLDKAHSLLELPSLAAGKEEYKAAGYYIQAAIDLLENKNEEAVSNAKTALDKGVEILDENYLIDTYKVLIGAYTNLEKYEELNTARISYDSLKEKRYEAEKIRQQQIASSKFNLEKYKQQLTKTRLANEISEHKASKNKLLFIFSAVMGGLMFLLIGILLYARYKKNHLLMDLREKNQLYLEAKEVSEKLAQSNTRFLSTISHELRTPLYGIIGLSSVLLRNEGLDSKSHEEIKSLKFSADYLLALVNDVLHINKFESEEGRKIQKDHFVLSILIDDIVQNFEFNNKKNNNTVHIEIDKNIPKVLLADKMKLSQVLMNLISNASKFTEDGDIHIQVQLEASLEDEVRVQFAVRDTGAGIPREEQDKIFDEFTQVKRANNHGGTGLGLPIVNKILNILESKLQLESVPGEGTEFSFALDLKKGSIEDMEKTIELPNFDSLKGKKVLIVDDNKINQLVTKKVLTLYGIQFEVANDGLEAVDKVKNNTFDTVLMDINMPNMNGFDASKEIRNFNKVVPIIALTASTYDSLGHKLHDYGIDDAIVKPYDTEMLLEALIKHIHLQKRYPFGTVASAVDSTVKFSG